jgi:uncharacterized surface protein with fasciclin (FAS1) repeats
MKSMLRILTVSSLVALAVPPAQAHGGSCGSDGQAQSAPDIVETARAAGNFATLAAALAQAGLLDALKSEGPFTVFAPTDEAFAKLPEGTVESLLEPDNREQLISILTYHVVSGELPAKQVVKLKVAETLNGQRLDIRADDSGVTVDKAQVVATDLMASNGVIHVIDSVMMPASETIVGVAEQAGSFGTLIAAAKAAGLAEALMGEGPFTVFAPTDEAFAALPAGTVESLLEAENRDKLTTILKYHVVSGRVFSDEVLSQSSVSTLAGFDVRISLKDGQARADESTIVATDIDASNGVIHVIDQVLLPNEERMSRANGLGLIEMAIDKGAPMYNHGNPAACAALYEMTANALITLGGDLPQDAHMALSNALVKMNQSHDPSDQAWIMRRGLDRAYAAMTMEGISQ